MTLRSKLRPMPHHTLSRIEWLDRFAHQLVEATDFTISLGEAMALAQSEYEMAFAGRPEDAALRVLSSYDSDNDLIDANWRAMMLLKRVSAGHLRRRG